MRIKKKNIREARGSETIAADSVDKIKADVEEISYDFKEMGIPEPDNVELASDVVINARDVAKKEVSETVRPSMTKSELVETVLGKENRRVVKTLKIKDIK